MSASVSSWSFLIFEFFFWKPNLDFFFQKTRRYVKLKRFVEVRQRRRQMRQRLYMINHFMRYQSFSNDKIGRCKLQKQKWHGDLFFSSDFLFSNPIYVNRDKFDQDWVYQLLFTSIPWWSFCKCQRGEKFVQSFYFSMNRRDYRSLIKSSWLSLFISKANSVRIR